MRPGQSEIGDVMPRRLPNASVPQNTAMISLLLEGGQCFQL